MRALAVSSRIEHVTVYARGARVRRVATVAASAEPPTAIRFTNLPLALIESSVRAEVVGGAAVAAQLRVSLDVPTTGATSGEEPEEVLAARRRVAAAAAELTRLEAALGALSGQAVVVADPSEEPPAPWSAVVAARQALVELRGAADLALRRRLIAARADATEARRLLALATERAARASSTRPPKVHELRRVVEVELARPPGGADAELRVAIEYRVAAARWVPSYVARIDGAAARVEIRAAVAQRTGEDWTGVGLALSTAQPDQFATLPELAPQKIGRRQMTPAKAGFRAPPAGGDGLFVDYDRSAPPRPPAPAPPRPADAVQDRTEPEPSRPMLKRAITSVVWDEESSRAKDAFHTPPQGVPMPAAAAKPRAASPTAAGAMPPPPPMSVPMSAPMPVQAPSLGGPPRGGFGGGGPPQPERDTVETAAAVPAPLRVRLDYTELRMAAADQPGRGSLVSAAAGAFAGAVAQAVVADVNQLSALVPPPHCNDRWADRYDYAFAADGTVDVPSDGGWHALAITAKPSTVVLRHVAVPREQADVFRLATITNPHDAPLLPGPIDVYDRGAYLVTSTVDLTPPGAAVDIGLGVDPQVKIARNAEFHEEAAGMLRGALKLIHDVVVEVDNRSARAVDLEVRDRVPVTRDGDDSVEVAVLHADPAWEPWVPDPDAPADLRLRGGRRWRVKVPASTKTTLRASYEVKLSSKLEIVGGNRREP
jgi:hypothetical protein